MLLWLWHYLSSFYHGFLVFTYFSLRMLLAAATSLVIVLVSGRPLIHWLQRQQVGQIIRQEGPKAHYDKKGTPTMGGVMIIFAIVISTLLWTNLANPAVWQCLLALIGFGMIGWWDDYLKLMLKHSRGLASRWKFFWQSLLGVILALWIYHDLAIANLTPLPVPFAANIFIHLGLGLVIFSYLMIVGFSNAVNLTDGLDGLAIMPSVLVALGLMIFAYLSGNQIWANYLLIPYIAHAADIAIVCAALTGAGLGFLWFNAFPAEVFMGDVGALAIGGLLGVIATLIRQEMLLLIMGGLFVWETLSVILQVGSYKLRKKRIFKMAPIHHHYELKGWVEPKIIVRFWIITLILVIISLSSLKLR